MTRFKLFLLLAIACAAALCGCDEYLVQGREVIRVERKDGKVVVRRVDDFLDAKKQAPTPAERKKWMRYDGRYLHEEKENGI